MHRALSKYWFRHGCREHEAACSSKNNLAKAAFPRLHLPVPPAARINNLAKAALPKLDLPVPPAAPKGCPGCEHWELWPVTESTWIIPKIKQCGAQRAGRNPPLPAGLWLVLRVNWFPQPQLSKGRAWDRTDSRQNNLPCPPGLLILFMGKYAR